MEKGGLIIYKAAYALEAAAFFFPRAFLAGASFGSWWIACSAETRARHAYSHISSRQSMYGGRSQDEGKIEMRWNNKGEKCARQ
jgi:hypothetical protein